MPIIYEWTGELFVTYEDGSDDIREQDFAETYTDIREALRALRHQSPHLQERIALYRQAVDADGWVTDTTYAYLDADGQLPKTFDDGAKVPVRFHRELAGARKA